jgi:hypothetical protein
MAHPQELAGRASAVSPHSLLAHFAKGQVLRLAASNIKFDCLANESVQNDARLQRKFLAR